MTYSTATRYIDKAPSVMAEGKERAKPSLLRFSLLMRLLGDPQRQIESVSIVGDLGKKGAAISVAAMLSAEGYKTGLIDLEKTENYRECFSVDGAYVSPSDFVSAAIKVIDAAKQIQKSYDGVKKGADASFGIDAVTQLFDARNISPIQTREELLAAIGTLILRDAGCRLTVISEIEGGSTSPFAIFPPSVATLVLSSVKDRVNEDKKGSIFFPEGVGEVVLEPAPAHVFDVISSKCIERGARLTLTASAAITPERRTFAGCEFTYKKFEKIFVPSLSYALVPRCAAIIELSEALSRRGFRISERALREGISKYRSEDRGDVFFVCAEPTVIMADPRIDGAIIDDVISCIDRIKSEKTGGLYIIDPCGELASKETVLSGISSKKWQGFDRLIISTDEAEAYSCNVAAAALSCKIEAIPPKAIAEMIDGGDAVIYFCPINILQRKRDEFISAFEHRHIKRGRK